MLTQTHTCIDIHTYTTTHTIRTIVIHNTIHYYIHIHTCIVYTYILYSTMPYIHTPVDSGSYLLVYQYTYIPQYNTICIPTQAPAGIGLIGAARVGALLISIPYYPPTFWRTNVRTYREHMFSCNALRFLFSGLVNTN